MSRCLITGAGGFLGSHLARYLARQGVMVYGLVRARNLHAEPGIEPLLCDVRDGNRLQSIMRGVRPDIVFHLAAQSSPSLSWKEPGLTFEVNVLGTASVLDAVRLHSPESRVVVASSSAAYGAASINCDGDCAGGLSEDAPLWPQTPYGISKAAAEQLTLSYARAYGLRALAVRPFFVAGPGKRGDVCSDFARGIVAIEQGQADRLLTGNLDSVRDFLDVHDAISGLWLLAEKGHSGEAYNLSSGVGTRIGDLLDRMAGLSSAKVATAADPQRLRPGDAQAVVGANAKLRALGWAPQVALDEMLEDVLLYWRREAARVVA